MEGIGTENSAVYQVKSPPNSLLQHVEDVAQLFILALNSKDDATQWNMLYAKLDNMGHQQCSVLEEEPQLQHYLQRAYCHSQLHNCLDIIENLQNYFPSSMALLIRGVLFSDIDPQPAASSKSTKCTQPVQKKTVSIFSPNISVPMTFMGPELTFNELENAASNVADDVLAFNRHLDHVDLSWPFSTVNNQRFGIRMPAIPTINHHDVALQPVYPGDDRGQAMEKSKDQLDQRVDGGPKFVKKRRSVCFKTGFDVVNGFAQGRLKHHELIYLNYLSDFDSRHFNPYDLIVVLSYEVKAEYYIASRFGFFNIQPDGNTDPIPFSVWCRNAALFSMLRRIPFFKNYLIRKTLIHWRANAHCNKFSRMRRIIEQTHLQYFPDVPQALLQIVKLIHELLSLKFYSFKPLKKYLLEDLEVCLEASHSMAERYLKKFFKYCHRVVSGVVEGSHLKVAELERILRHQPTVFEATDVAMCTEMSQRKKLEQDLQRARYQANRMGDFTMLVDQLLHHSLLQLARENAAHYLSLLLQRETNNLVDDDSCSDSDDSIISGSLHSISQHSMTSAGEGQVPDALLLAKLDFNHEGILSVMPSLEQITNVLVNSLHKIVNIISTSTCSVETAASTSTTNSVHKSPSPAVQPTAQLNTLKVKGKAMHLTISPLLRENFREQLQNDSQLGMDLSQIDQLASVVCEDVNSFFSRQSWLNNVKAFVNSYSSSSVKEFLLPKKFKETMHSLRGWLCDLRALPEYKICKYSLICINLKEIITVLSPLLEHISISLTNAALDEITEVGDKLHEEISQYNNALIEKRYDLEGFAGYSWQIRGTDNFVETAKPRIKFVQQMSEVLIALELCGDEEYCKQLLGFWQSFLTTFQQAKEFVSSQTPLKAQGLEENIKSNEEEGMKLLEIINSGDYINPLSDPNIIISQAKEVQDRMYIIKSLLLGLSKWKEAITGKPHDMSLLSKLITAVDVRLELWKYRRVYDVVLNDWLKCPFKRLDISHVAKKVSDWIRAAEELKQQLPVDDLVIDDWMTKLINFQSRIPLLQSLTAKAIKPFHWQSIFSVLGQHYDPNVPFTLNDLLIYNIDQHASLLREICSSAVKEHQLQQDLYSIQTAWDGAVIKTSRFNADKFLFAVMPSSRGGGGSRQRPREKMATFLIGGVIHASHGLQQFYKVDECDQLSATMEDHLIQLQNLLSSPYVTPFRSQVENWLTSLTQLLELVSTLIKCQGLWLDLLNKFQAIDVEMHEACGVDQLQTVTKQFQEIIDSITDDPRALSLLGKKRGQKGFREIQGDSLRISLDSIYKSLENIVKTISNHLRIAWSVFPRLHYLSHVDALPLLSVNTNTNKLMDTISKVLPITSVKQLDIISHMEDKAEEGVQLVMVEGQCKEEIELVSPLPISKEPVYRWLTGLHRAIQFSIACNLRECITAMPKGIFSNVLPSHDEILSWLKQYSVQCVLLALEVQWSSIVTTALTSEPVQLQPIMCNMEQCLQSIVSIIRMSHSSTRLYIALSNIVVSLKNKLDCMHSLPNDSGWLWHCVVKYSVDQDRGQQDAIEVQKCSFSTMSDDSGRLPVRGRVSLIPAYCKVDVGDCSCWYDYEYRCPSQLMVATSHCEQSLAKLLISFHQYYSGLLWGPTGTGKSELVQQIALILGRHYYWHQFNGNISVSVIEWLLKAAMSTGSVLLLSGLSKLSTVTLLTLADLFSSVRQQFSMACLNKNVLIATSASKDEVSHNSNRTTPASGVPLARSSHSRSSGLSSEKNRIRKKINWYNDRDCTPFNSHIDCTLSGASLRANSAFRCVVECRMGRQQLPALLIEQLRPVRVIVPDTVVLADVLLLSEGFLHSIALAKKMSLLWNMLKSQSSTIIQTASNNVCTIKKIVKQAACLLSQQLNTSTVTDLAVEEESLVHSIWCHLDCKLEQADKKRLIEMLKITFSCPITPHVLPANRDQALKEAIEMELTDHHLQCLPSFVNKVLQLHRCLLRNKIVVLVGPSCSGKTTCYKTLSAAYHRLNMATADYPKIHKLLVNMLAYSMEQLYGSDTPSDDGPEGMMFQLLQRVGSEAKDMMQYWLVCDGLLEFNKMEVFKELVSGDGLLSLNNGHKLTLNDSYRLLLETDSIDQLPPSIAVHCAIIHMDKSVIPWRAVVDAWLEQAPTRHSLGSVCVEALSELLLQLIPKGSEFIGQHSVCQQQGLTVNFVQTLLTILSAQFQRIAPVMDRPAQFTASSSRCFSRDSLTSSTFSMHNLESGSLQMTTSSQLGDRSSASLKSSEVSDDREDDDLTSFDLEIESRRNLQRQMVHVFVYAYTWSIASHTSLRYLAELNTFVKEQMNHINLPLDLPDKTENMTDLYLNLKDFSFSLWNSREREPKTADYIPIPEIEKYAYLIELLLSTGNHVLLRGEEGCGKTSLIKYLVQPRLSLARIPITNNTTVDALQDLLLQKINQMLRFSLTKQVGSRKSSSSQHVLFLDDFHTGEAGCQQLVYQVLSQSSLMDLQRNYYQHPFYNTSIIAGHTPQHQFSDRLMNKMVAVPLYPITNKSLHKIMYRSTAYWLQQFPETAVEDVSLLASVLATASVSMHFNVMTRLTGSLSQLYHFFTMKDLLNIYYGLLQMTGTQGAAAAIAKTHEQFTQRLQSRRSGTLSGLKEKMSSHKQKSKKHHQSSMLSKSMRSKHQLQTSTDYSTMRAILRLWCHEVTRVYADRLNNSHDKLWFLKLLEMTVRFCFCGIHPQSGAPQITRPGRTRVSNRTGSITELKQLGINIDVLMELSPQPGEKLLDLDQLMMKGEDLTGLMFAQLELDDFYRELGDGQVMDYLNKAITHYNIDHSKSLDLILFRRAIEHVTRLCRVMRPGGGHAMLVGSKSTGKKSITKLAAHVKHCQLVELPADGTLTEASLKQLLREVCITTGIEAKPVVLLVSSDKTPTEYMLTIAELMSEGIVQSLFTPSELLVMSSRRPGSGNRMNKKKPRTAEAAYQLLAECALQYLHVVVCWDQSDSDILSTRLLVNGYTFRLVYKACSYVDLYEPWGKDSYLDVAVRWLKDQSAPSWEEWIESDSQLEAVSSLAVHMHLTANKQAGPVSSAAVLSPATFIECLSISKTIALHIRKEEKCSMERYRLALGKLWTLEKDVQQLEGNIAELQPLLDATQSESESMMSEISSEKQRYMEANARCKDAESTINSESMNVKQLQSIVDREFDKVAPVYKRALEALSSVKSNDVLEMTGYVNPPELLLPVADCLCMLFDRPQSWTDCKQLLLSKDFLKSLRFYDRDNITKSKLKFLQKMTKKMPEGLDPNMVGKASQAVVSICQWIQALVAYHTVNEMMEPHRKKLKLAEDTLMTAHEVFVAMKKDMLTIKDSLEQRVKSHKELVRRVRSIEQDIETVQRKLNKARKLEEALSEDKDYWQKMLSEANDNISTAAADGLLTAGSVCYLCSLHPNMVTELYENWIDYCKGKVDLGEGLGSVVRDQAAAYERIKIRTNCNSCEILTSSSERAFWTKENTFAGPVMKHQLLSAKIAANYLTNHLPLIFDPHNLFLDKVKFIEVSEEQIQLLAQGSVSQLTETSNHAITYVSADNLSLEQLDDIIISGKVLVITCKSVNELSGVVAKKLISSNITTYLVLTGNTLSDIIAASPSKDLTDYSVINFSFSSSDLTAHLLILIIQLERPEFIIRLRSVHNDISLHQQQIYEGRAKVLSTIMSSSSHLLSECDQLMELLVGVANIVDVARDRIREAKKHLRELNYQKIGYNVLAEFAGVMMEVINQVTVAHPYYHFSLHQLQSIINSVITKYGQKKLREGMVTQAHMMQMKQYLLNATYQQLCCQLFDYHHDLFPLLLSIKLSRSKGKISNDEVDLMLLDTSKPHFTTTILREVMNDRPHWMTNQAWAGVCYLHNHCPVFDSLPEMISNNSLEWHEYFNSDQPSLMTPTPSTAHQYSMFQKLILWKIMKPSKVDQVIKCYILDILGNKYCHSPTITVHQRLKYLDASRLCSVMLSNDASLAVMDLSNFEQLAVTASVAIAQLSVHTITSLDSLISQLESNEERWLVVTNIQLLPDPELALSKLLKAMKLCAETCKVFVALPVHVVCNDLSPQLSSLLHTRMADYDGDISTAISSSDPLKRLYNDTVQEQFNNSLPLNWLMCDLKFTSQLVEEMSSSQYQSNMIKWLFQDDNEQSDTSNTRSSRYYYTILPTVNHTVSDVHHLVLTMLTIIPVPLANELEDYNNESVIKRHLLNSCLMQFNQLLQGIRTSLTQLSDLLSGYYDTIDDKLFQLLQCLLANKVPTGWDCPLSLPTAAINLTSYLQILQRMESLLTQQLLQEPYCDNIDITYIPNISGLLQEFMLYYCNTNNLPADKISLSCELLEELPEGHHDDGLMILTANELSLVTDQSTTAVTAIKVTPSDSTDHHVQCPLILAIAQSYITQLILTVNYTNSYKNTVKLIYRLQ